MTRYLDVAAEMLSAIGRPDGDAHRTYRMTPLLSGPDGRTLALEPVIVGQKGELRMGLFSKKAPQDPLLEALNHKLRIGWIAMDLDPDVDGLKNLRSNVMRAALDLAEAGRTDEAISALTQAERDGSDAKDGVWNYLMNTCIDYLSGSLGEGEAPSEINTRRRRLPSDE